jgi:hypothetical protein
MANKNWIAGATENKGALHRHLGIPEGQRIPNDVLARAARQPGVVGQEARLAQQLKGMHKKHT